MLINELAKATGVTIHTIRYYENLGLIKGTSNENVKSNNYKNYDENARERLLIILEAKEVGFTLAEIRTLLESWYGNNSTREEQVEIFTTKIAEVDAKIKQLKAVKKRLEKVVKDLENNNC
jgi:MerR family transcriptional regulator, copper efflux regulator